MLWIRGIKGMQLTWIVRALAVTVAMGVSPLQATTDILVAGDTVDRVLLIPSSISTPDEWTNDPYYSGLISFVWAEVFRHPRKDGASIRKVTSVVACSSANLGRYKHINEELFAMKDGDVVPLVEAREISRDAEDVRPVSIERLVVDKACWAAFGRAKGEPEPAFGVQPKDAKRIVCTTGKGDEEITFHIAFHEQTSRVFWNEWLAIDATLTDRAIALPLHVDGHMLRFSADRITGKAMLGSEKEGYLSLGECSKAAAPKF